ncbi:MAG: hypothetical protein KC609_17600 [Myxococcales bacterium]|nr:hypothetical protein [Myxococcales bacterium]
MVFKVIPQQVLETLRQLLVFDKYQKASSTDGEFGTKGQDKEVLLERVAQFMLPDFFVGAPTDPVGPEMLRDGAEPFSGHLESGAGASDLVLSATLRTILGRQSVPLDISDQVTTTSLDADDPYFFVGFVVLYTYSRLVDVNIDPAKAIGDVTLTWHDELDGLLLTIEFETSGTEIVGSHDTNFDQILSRVLLRPRISAGRCLWDWGVMAQVSVTDSSLTRRRYAATTKPLYDSMCAVFGDLDTGVDDIPDKAAAAGLASALRRAFTSFVRDNAELVGNVILALPLRPTAPNAAKDVRSTLFDALSTVLQSSTDEALSDAGAVLSAAVAAGAVDAFADELDERTAWLLSALFGWSDAPAFEAALGFQNMINVLPFHTISSTASAFVKEFITFQQAWSKLVAPPPPNTLDPFADFPAWAIAQLQVDFGLYGPQLDHLLRRVVPRKFEQTILDRIELASVVNRLRRYVGVSVFNGTVTASPAGPVFEAAPEGAPTLVGFLDSAELEPSLAPLPTGVPCMRYQLSLELIELTGSLAVPAGGPQSAEALQDQPATSILSELAQAQAKNPNLPYVTYYIVGWEVYQFHAAFNDPLDPSAWSKDSAGLFPGAQLVAAETRFVPFSGFKTGLDGSLSKTVFLEWSTSDSAQPNSKLLVFGSVAHTIFGPLGTFRMIVPMTSQVGLYPESGDGAQGVDNTNNVVTFQATPGPLMRKNNLAYNIYGRLVQQPYARDYQWVSLSVTSFRIGQKDEIGGTKTLNIPDGFPFQIEARLNGVTFQTSELFVLANSSGVAVQSQLSVAAKTIQRGISVSLGAGWSQNIVYSSSAVAGSFQLTLIARVFNVTTLKPIAEIPINRAFHRFEDAAGAPVVVEPDPLVPLAQHAYDSGAIAEWAIPFGRSFKEYTLKSDGSVASAVARVSNKNFDPGRTPVPRVPRNVRVDFVKAFVHDNAEDGGTGEIRFQPGVSVRDENEPDAYTYSSKATRQFDVEDNEEVVFPGPPSISVSGHPGSATMTATCFAQEEDLSFWYWIGLEKPYESLGTAKIERSFESDVDGTASANSAGPDGDFDLTCTFTTTSAPPPAQLTFEGEPFEIDFKLSLADAPVVLQYDVGWAEKAWLMHAAEDEEIFELHSLLPIPNGTITVSPNASMRYRIHSSSAASAAAVQGVVQPSRELVVQIDS